MVLSTATRDGSSTDLVDLAHETLLRYDRNKQPYWGTLRTAITTYRKTIENRQLAEVLAKEWRDKGSSRWSGLATRAQCQAFQPLRDLSDHGAAYVAASRRVRNSQNLILAMLAILLIPYLAVAGWAQVKFNGLETRLAAKVILTQLGIDSLSPKMVLIKAGTFSMGDLRVHEVVPQKDFKLGQYEVTFDDYEPFLKVTGHNGGVISDEGWGRGSRPVINVSWEDANAYLQWLSQQTGKRYRLPTEAEWEYAARSGEKDETWAGTSDEKQLSDYAVYHMNRTESVGSKRSNRLGLYDMSGNVWEWVENCWKRETDSTTIEELAGFYTTGGNCGHRVMRGGSWSDGPVFLRSSTRLRYNPDNRLSTIGFRLAQDLP